MNLKVLAFAGSSSKHSINKQLVTYASTLIPNARVEILDLNDYEMPVFSVDKEAQFPAEAKKMAEKIDQSDLILISLAEHNGAYSAAFKNVFDWVSRIPDRKVFADKKVFLLATSPGARGGSSVLEIAKNRFPFNGGVVVGTFSLPSFNQNFKEGTGITNPELNKQLIAALAKI